MRRLFVATAICGLLMGATSVMGATRAFRLTGVTFTDGGTATGTFDYDTVASNATDWSIVISGGDTGTFPPITLTPANSTVVSEADGCSQNTLNFKLNASLRQFRVTPTQPLATASDPVSLDLICFSSSGSIECFDCYPYRYITAGQLDPLAAIPALGTRGLTILTVLLAAGGVAALLRRRFA